MYFNILTVYPNISSIKTRFYSSTSNYKQLTLTNKSLVKRTINLTDIKILYKLKERLMNFNTQQLKLANKVVLAPNKSTLLTYRLTLPS
ncbi:hypothetical protein DSM106972_045740 [Dulcicalothrix desertica PCC 7102]|uniref:Uncharacterized protein n=1 Tax=Dulcicalothrix desertica PCC 7102 TaxID=232991 RepID=A0A433VE11_9CYAN|nr:hypothetical protein DSM106972_045740 [Dulcicalothrix desertica PCC 7102]